MGRGDVVGGKYRLTRRIGVGAMGEVWAAVNESTGREFAVKFLTTEAGDSLDNIERLLREARAAGRIQHRNVVDLFDVGTGPDGMPFLVMQLLIGEPLDVRLARDTKLEPSIAAAIVIEIARGLGAAHALGVVHRDLKPANIFLHLDGEFGTVVKVVDFSVSKLASEKSSTVTGTAVGSPAYMSPEQARGEKTLDGRSDLWALGVILFQLITGKLPFDGATAFDIVAEILKGDIPRLATAAPEVDPRFDAIVGCCLSRDRDLRPTSAAELITMLEPLAGDRDALHDLVTQSLVDAQRVSGSVIAASQLRHEINDDELPETQEADELAGQIAPRRAQSSAPPRSQVSTLSVAAATLALTGGKGAAKAPAPTAAGAALGSKVLASMTAAGVEEGGPASDASSMTPSQIAVVTPSHRWLIGLIVAIVTLALALGLWEVTGPH